MLTCKLRRFGNGKVYRKHAEVSVAYNYRVAARGRTGKRAKRHKSAVQVVLIWSYATATRNFNCAVAAAKAQYCALIHYAAGKRCRFGNGYGPRYGTSVLVAHPYGVVACCQIVERTAVAEGAGTQRKLVGTRATSAVYGYTARTGAVTQYVGLRGNGAAQYRWLC